MTAADVLSVARGELGVTESPRGSNRVKYNEWYYGRPVQGDAYPWCMVFVQWVFSRAGVPVPVRTASCGALMRGAKAAGRWVTAEYRPGDVLIYDFPGGAATDHCGICESAGDGRVTAIEGNTSAGNAANGGGVLRMTRAVSLVVGAWRPEYGAREEKQAEEETEMTVYQTVEDVPQWYRPTIERLVAMGALKGTDGQGSINVDETYCRVMTTLDRLGKI